MHKPILQILRDAEDYDFQLLLDMLNFSAVNLPDNRLVSFSALFSYLLSLFIIIPTSNLPWLA